jgi:hypothetical protein
LIDTVQCSRGRSCAPSRRLLELPAHNHVLGHISYIATWRSSGVGGLEDVYASPIARRARERYTVITRAMHIHPTVAEYMPTLLGNLEPLN